MLKAKNSTPPPPSSLSPYFPPFQYFVFMTKTERFSCFFFVLKITKIKGGNKLWILKHLILFIICPKGFCAQIRTPLVYSSWPPSKANGPKSGILILSLPSCCAPPEHSVFIFIRNPWDLFVQCHALYGLFLILTSAIFF